MADDTPKSTTPIPVPVPVGSTGASDAASSAAGTPAVVDAAEKDVAMTDAPGTGAAANGGGGGEQAPVRSKSPSPIIIIYPPTHPPQHQMRKLASPYLRFPHPPPCLAADVYYTRHHARRILVN